MGAADGLKQAASVLRAADKIPEYNAILDAQQRIFDLQNENQGLKEEIQKLHKKLAIKKKITFDLSDGVYRLEGDNRAWCPVCYEKDAQLSTLRWKESQRFTSSYFCNICKTQVYKGGYAH